MDGRELILLAHSVTLYRLPQEDLPQEWVRYNNPALWTDVKTEVTFAPPGGAQVSIGVSMNPQANVLYDVHFEVEDEAVVATMFRDDRLLIQAELSRDGSQFLGVLQGQAGWFDVLAVAVRQFLRVRASRCMDTSKATWDV